MPGDTYRQVWKRHYQYYESALKCLHTHTIISLSVIIIYRELRVIVLIYRHVYACFIVFDCILVSILLIVYGLEMVIFDILSCMTFLVAYDVMMGIFQSLFDVFTRTIIATFVMMIMVSTVINIIYPFYKFCCCKHKVKKTY